MSLVLCPRQYIAEAFISLIVKVTEPSPKPEPESEDEDEDEDEPRTEPRTYTGTVGTVELAQIIDGYLPCFSSMDIQTESPSKQNQISPPSLPKRATLGKPVRQPTRRSPRKLPNAGSYIPEEAKKETNNEPKSVLTYCTLSTA